MTKVCKMTSKIDAIMKGVTRVFVCQTVYSLATFADSLGRRLPKVGV